MEGPRRSLKVRPFSFCLFSNLGLQNRPIVLTVLPVVSFNPTSSGQVSLVIYEWSDVEYLGVDTPDNSVGGISRPVRSCTCLNLVLSCGLTIRIEDVYLYYFSW